MHNGLVKQLSVRRQMRSLKGRGFCAALCRFDIVPFMGLTLPDYRAENFSCGLKRPFFFNLKPEAALPLPANLGRLGCGYGRPLRVEP